MSEQGMIESPGHEPDRVPLRVVFVSVAMLLVMLFGSELGVWALMPRVRDERAAPAAGTPATRDWGPGGLEQLRRLHEREARNLGTTEWLDEQHSAGRIPIERAMEILAAQRSRSGAGGAP